MNRGKNAWTANLALAALLAVAMVTAGCNTRPSPIESKPFTRVTSIPVSPADAEESSAVQNYLSAKDSYEMALKVLNAYYTKVGAFDQQKMTENELKTLQTAQTWRFEGVQPPPKPEPQSIEDATQAGLAEQVVACRRNFKAAIDKLIELYSRRGDGLKVAAMKNVEDRIDPVLTYEYILNAEIPPAGLKGNEVIAEADALFDQAVRIHKAGKPLPLITDYRKEREALIMFLRLVHTYPTSNKIALAAYYIGDIYKEYFNEDIRAVNWYQRAWEWDPYVLKPARFQAAVVYEGRLAEPAKALPLYRDVLKYEQFVPSNVRYARDRIKELTGKEP